MIKNNNLLRVGSDFSGIGAFDFALKRLGVKHQNVFACDIDKFVKISYHSNHTPDNWYTDVYDRPIPKDALDIYMTSPPCQVFSIAGNRNAENAESDSRGILFYNSLDFIRQNKPKVFIFENVKGLLSAENGTVFNKWIENLGGGYVNNVDNSLLASDKALPYNIYYQVLNSRNYGVPQNRERIFIVGIRNDIDFKFNFPNTTDNTKRMKSVLQVSADDKYFLSPKMIAGFKATQLKYEAKFKVRVGSDIACCILASGTDKINSNYVYQKNNIRRLTPLECWRLQGIEDKEFMNVKNAGISNSQLYKQAGNSITVNVLSEILKSVMPIFEDTGVKINNKERINK